jgi:putative DNA primase/helicase
MFLLGEELEQLDAIMDHMGEVVLVSIDPITAFMGKINSSSVTDVRGQLGPLADLAERRNVAFTTVTHPPKAHDQNAINNFIGSQAFIAAARIGHLSLPEMTFNDMGAAVPTGRNLLTSAAGNHKKMPTLAYRIEELLVRQPTEPGDRAAAIRARAHPVETVKVVWEGEVSTTADEGLAALGNRKGDDSHAVDSFLRDVLAKGPQLSTDVIARAEAKGFTRSQLRRAQSRLGISREAGTVRKHGLHGWEWMLPDAKK